MRPQISASSSSMSTPIRQRFQLRLKRSHRPSPPRPTGSSSTESARTRLTTMSSNKAMQRSGRTELLLAGWDLDDTVVAAIKSGASAFTIDQQPYWRGYMPVLLMTHYLRYGLLQANPFLTGPAIIDKTNIETVQNLAS